MKKAIGILSGASSLLVLASPAFAQTLTVCPGEPFAVLCNIRADNIIPSLLVLAFVVAIIVALAFLVYGGFKWLTSQGDKAAVEGARGTIIAAIIGLVIIFLSFFILNLVGQLFFGRNLTELLVIPSGGIFNR